MEVVQELARGVVLFGTPLIPATLAVRKQLTYGNGAGTSMFAGALSYSISFLVVGGLVLLFS